MLHDLFPNRATPLYSRTRKLLRVEPMDYAAFWRTCGHDPAEMASFDRLSLVGGILRHSEFLEPNQVAFVLV